MPIRDIEKALGKAGRARGCDVGVTQRQKGRDVSASILYCCVFSGSFFKADKLSSNQSQLLEEPCFS